MSGYGYLRRMLDMLTGAYNRSDMRGADKGEPPQTNIGRLFSTFAWGLEFVHESAETIRLWDDIEKAQGATLDRYGANFGVERQGTEDAFYRLLIMVKIMAQLSGGDVDTVINAICVLFAIDPEVLDFGERFPAKVRIELDDVYLDADRVRLAPIILRLVKRILPAGVGFEAAIYSRRRADTAIAMGGIGIVYDHARAVLPPPAPALAGMSIGAVATDFRHDIAQSQQDQEAGA